jgi:DNA-binding response OmpR family regulator
MEARALALGADRYLGKDAGMEAVRATVRAVARARRGPDRALDLHDDVVQGLTAIHWALEASAHEQAKEAARATLARAQAIIGELVAGDPAGRLRRDAPAAQRP